MILAFVWLWPHHEEKVRQREASRESFVPYRDEAADRVLAAMLTYPNPVLFSPQNTESRESMLQAWGGEIGDCFILDQFYTFMEAEIADRYMKLCNETGTRMELIGLEYNGNEITAMVQINAKDPVRAVFTAEFTEDNLLQNLTVKDDKLLIEAIS
ncbi:MAG: hypothetical protein IKT31_07770 [Firmicutes bacterium]|nr:hypothetical protein [Bacillota bacterium]